MSITAPQAIGFSNQSIRPTCEQIRAFKAVIDAIVVDWFGTKSAFFPNDSTVLADGRENEQSVNVITGADVTNVLTQVLALQAVLNVSGVAEIIAKPCVRPLQAS